MSSRCRFVDKHHPLSEEASSLNLRRCGKCLGVLAVSEFNKDNRRLDKITNWCRECQRFDDRIRAKTPETYIYNLYKNIRIRCGHGLGGKNYFTKYPKQSGNSLDFTLADFKDWIYSQESFAILWNAFEDEGFIFKMSPAVTRVDSDKPYTLENLSIVTKSDISKATMILVNKRRRKKDEK